MHRDGRSYDLVALYSGPGTNGRFRHRRAPRRDKETRTPARGREQQLQSIDTPLGKPLLPSRKNIINRVFLYACEILHMAGAGVPLCRPMTLFLITLRHEGRPEAQCRQAAMHFSHCILRALETVSTADGCIVSAGICRTRAPFPCRPMPLRPPSLFSPSPNSL